MFENPFEGCWNRFDRAKTHNEAAVNEWNAYLGREPYDARLIVQSDGHCTLWIEEIEPVPPLLSVLFGEWAYNLRAALDYCAYAVAVWDSGGLDPPPNHARIQFPIYSDEPSFLREKDRIKKLSEKHRKMLEAIQPYHGLYGPRGTVLYWINQLARIDRHRRLHVVGMTPAESFPLVRVPEGSTVTFEDVEPSFVEGEAVVARFQVSPHSPGDKVEANPNTVFDVEIKELADQRPRETEWLWLPMGRRLYGFETLIAEYIASFEIDCTGSSREFEIVEPD